MRARFSFDFQLNSPELTVLSDIFLLFIFFSEEFSCHELGLPMIKTTTNQKLELKRDYTEHLFPYLKMMKIYSKCHWHRQSQAQNQGYHRNLLPLRRFPFIQHQIHQQCLNPVNLHLQHEAMRSIAVSSKCKIAKPQWQAVYLVVLISQHHQ